MWNAFCAYFDSIGLTPGTTCFRCIRGFSGCLRGTMTLMCHIGHGLKKDSIKTMIPMPCSAWPHKLVYQFLLLLEGLGRQHGTRHRNAVLRWLTAALLYASKKAYAMPLAALQIIDLIFCVQSGTGFSIDKNYSYVYNTCKDLYVYKRSS
jgi:hypothetical protein